MNRIKIEPNEVIFKNPTPGITAIQSLRITNTSRQKKSLVNFVLNL